MARITVSDQELDDIIYQQVREFEDFFDLEFTVDIQLGDAIVSVKDLLSLKAGDTLALDREAVGYVLVAVGEKRVGEAEVMVRKNRPQARVVRVF